MPTMRVFVCGLILALAASGLACRRAEAPGATAAPPPTIATLNALAARVDPLTDKTRVVVMTDIANEPDDQMSMVRFLVYANEFDVEGLIATTSTWMRNKIRPDVIRHVIDAYAQVQSSLASHAPGFPTAEALRAVVAEGQPTYGMAGVGQDRMSPGAVRIIAAADKADGRPLWVLGWGGTNTLAQALRHVRETRTPEQLAAFVARLRVYTISDQDDAGPWIRREFPALFYVAHPSTPDGDEYYRATWTGISGDRFYKNGDGADFTTFTDAWVDAHIRSKGPLGKVYIYPCCIHEGDTPSFLGLINNGLASASSPSYGGWGGRYVWRQPYGESRPFWTQGGDAYPGRDSSRDTVVGLDDQPHTSDPATIWRWRRAFQSDFAARMDWTVKDRASANHNPLAVVNGEPGRAPVTLAAEVGTPLRLDAAGTSDPEGHAVTYRWTFYAEAGTGVPEHPVSTGPAVPIGGGGNLDEGGIPSAAAGGASQPPPRVVVRDSATMQATVIPQTPGIAHVILEVEDAGSPRLTSYRRVILNVAARVR